MRALLEILRRRRPRSRASDGLRPLCAGAGGAGAVNDKLKVVLALVVAIVLLDQGTKAMVDRTMPLYQSIPVIENVFSLTYIRNTGAAFGFLATSGELFRRTFLIGFSLAAIGFILVLLRRLPRDEKTLTVALGFILGGAAGNLIDR